MNRLAAVASSAGVAAMLFVSVYAIMPVAAFDFDANPDPLVLVPPSNAYGYVTFQPHSMPSGDLTVDAKKAVKWSASITGIGYWTDTTNPSPNGMTPTAARNVITSEASTWYNAAKDTSKIASLNYQGEVDVGASLASSPCGTNSKDTKKVMTFCDLTPLGYSSSTLAVTFTSPGRNSGNPTIMNLAEVDIIFNNAIDWSSGNLDPLAVHEFGHLYGLGDLRYLYGGSGGSGGCLLGTPDFSNTMCVIQENVGWGDKDGVRWLYPKISSFNLDHVGVISGSDLAVTQIPGSGSNPDIMFVWGDYVSATDETLIKGLVVWDVNPTTGVGTIGPFVQMENPPGGTFRDVGATFALVDGDATPDLIVSFNKVTTAYPTGVTLYHIFWDITKASSPVNSFTCGGSSCETNEFGPSYVGITDDDKGTDVLVFDLPVDPEESEKDLVLYGVRDNGAGDELSYTRCQLLSDGTRTGCTSGGSSGIINIDSDPDYIGAAITYDSARIGIVNYREGSGWINQPIYHFKSSPTSTQMDEHIFPKYAPAKTLPSTITGLGSDAYHLGERSDMREIFIGWSDSTKGYYIIEWDSRLNSHP